MKVKDVMTAPAIRISPEESVNVAARTLAHYNIGALPVCGSNGQLCGLVTDRDIVTRCLAAERAPENTAVRAVMTGRVLSVNPETPAEEAAKLMAAQQVRRLPVVEQGKVCGMVSLGDLAQKTDAGQTLSAISCNVGWPENKS